MPILIRTFFITLCFFHILHADIFTIDAETLQQAEREYGVNAKKRIVDLTQLLNTINHKISDLSM